MRKILGILLLIGGIVLIVLSINIKSRAEMGQMQLSNAQERVSEENRPYLRPLARERSREMSENAEERIGEGTATVENYEQLARWMQIGGIACLLLGAWALFMPKRRT